MQFVASSVPYPVVLSRMLRSGRGLSCAPTQGGKLRRSTTFTASLSPRTSFNAFGFGWDLNFFHFAFALLHRALDATLVGAKEDITFTHLAVASHDFRRHHLHPVLDGSHLLVLVRTGLREFRVTVDLCVSCNLLFISLSSLLFEWTLGNRPTFP